MSVGRRVGVAGLAGLAAVAPVGIGSADPPHRTKLAAAASVDSVGHVGDIVEAETDFHTLASARFTWTHGVTSRIPSWTHDVRVAVFVLVNDADQRVDGNLWAKGVKTGAPTRAIARFEPRSGDGPTVTLRAGAHPTVDITHLPTGTRRVEIVTAARGRSLLRFTDPCRRHLRHEAWRATIRFHRAVHARIKRNDLSVSCGYPFGPAP
jgi:hypothetical protein